MRTFLTFAIVLIITAFSSANAAVPQLINYQGVLADSTGAGLDTTVNITFSIYENAVGLTAIWVEAHAGVIVTGGLFSVLLGSVTPLDVSIFGAPIRYLGITVGADPEMSPRTQLVSVPYAFNSKHADLAIYSDSAGADGSGWTDDGTVVRLDAAADSVGIGTSAPSEKLDVVGNLVVSGKATIGSGHTNTGTNAFVGGGQSNTASGFVSTVGGGQFNTASGVQSTVSGGTGNTALGIQSTVGGGDGNAASAVEATVGGGRDNTASSDASTVGGGVNNTASGFISTVGGGIVNFASGQLSTVGGGAGDTASGFISTVGGGEFNTASGAHSTVPGGQSNTASAIYSTVGGGRNNTATFRSATVSGGEQNTASANSSTVGGGLRNIASGTSSAVIGGYRNTASGVYSVAMGAGAKAQHNGSIVIAASDVGGLSTDSIASGGAEQLVIRADSGIYLTNVAEVAPYDPTKLINTVGGAYLSGNGTTWTNASDKNQKENFTDIDSEELLKRISELPISRWNYKDEDETVTHIGPVAQDFYALFGVGADDVSISTIDPAGIALAAIKALNKDNKELNKRLEKLEKMIDEFIK